MERRIRPTLVIGIGRWGAQVAAAFARRVAGRAGRLPIVRAVALVLEEEEDHAPAGVTAIPLSPPHEETSAALASELGQIRRLDAVQATRRLGWVVEGGLGSGVVLVTSLGDEPTRGLVPGVARLLRELSERDFAYRLALSAVLLLPRDGKASVAAASVAPSTPTTTEAVTAGHQAASRQDLCGGRLGMAADDVRLFDEGCCLLDQVNADGLLVATGEEQADVVACWLALRVLTPLQAALERMPPTEAGASFDAFGLAAWEFPLEPLTTCLARRWQRQVLGRLLAPAGDDQGAAAPFLEQHGWAGPAWLREAPVRFRVVGDAWARPALALVRELRSEMDRAVEAERARLKDLVVQGEESFDAACAEARDVLAAEVHGRLDGPGLGATESFLIALEEAARSRTARLEREAQRCCDRVMELDQAADEAGQALDDLTGRFPPFRLNAVLKLLLRPWRLLRLWLLYREVGHRAGVYLAYRHSQWLLQAQAGQRKWQAAFYARLAQVTGETMEAVAQLRTDLERLRGRLAPDPALEQALGQQLETAALPPGLADHFYRRATGEGEAAPASVLALYGPLSRWMREGWTAETLGPILAEHAREQFAFLGQVRLDELLARTYSGAELRRRLAALVDAAAPWWACDEPALSAEERACLRRLVLVGLPDADSSLLVELMPDRPVFCFSTGDRHQVVAIQVMQGLGG